MKSLQPIGFSLPPLSEIEKEIDRRECAKSFAAFVKKAWHIVEPVAELKWGWALDAICDHLEAVHRGDILKLLMNVPPGCMKSLLTGVFFPAWEWGPKGRKDLRYLGTAHKQDLAVRDNLKCRRLIQSQWFQDRWPITLTGDQNAKTKFENDMSGFREAMAFSGMTGSRGDRVLLDDPLSVDDANSEAELTNAELTFTEALPTRLNNDDSAIVVIMQRLHERDTSGLILSRNLGYTHLMLPMEFEPARRCTTMIGFQDPRTEDGELLFPERFSPAKVKDLKKTMGSYATAGQFQQRPMPREGGLFKRRDFGLVHAVPAGTEFVRGWDLASTADGDGARTAGVKIGRTPEGRYVVADCIAERLSAANVRKVLKSTAAADNSGGEICKISLPKDPGQAGKDQAQQLVAMLAGYIVSATPESGDKITRAEPFAAQVEAGNVDLLEGDWNEAFLSEVELFPGGALKDIVDASSRAFNEVALQTGRVFSKNMASLEISPMQIPDFWPRSYAIAADAGSVVVLWGAWDGFGACHIYGELELQRGSSGTLETAIAARGREMRGVLTKSGGMNDKDLKEFRTALRRQDVYTRQDDKSPELGMQQTREALSAGLVKIFSNLDRLKTAYRTYYMDENGEPAEPSLWMDAMRGLIVSGRQHAQTKTEMNGALNAPSQPSASLAGF